jgi:electron transport complex protein RnfC
MGLVPLDLAALIRAGELKRAVATGLKDCIGCGTCSYVCPSNIPLVQFFNHAKGQLAANERDRAKQEAIRELVDARTQRMERETIEKAAAAARRKAERERAKAAALAATPPPDATAAETPGNTEESTA